jgi:hypothetical protein
MRIVTGVILVIVLGSVIAGAQPALPEQLLGQYYGIQKSLASDSINGVSAAATQIASLSTKAAVTDVKNKSQFTALANAAQKLKTADLKAARNGFGDLSDALIAYLKTAQTKHNPPYQFYCPMVKKNWLQPDKGIRNPYYGSEMLTCGELVQTGPSAGQPKEHSQH